MSARSSQGSMAWSDATEDPVESTSSGHVPPGTHSNELRSKESLPSSVTHNQTKNVEEEKITAPETPSPASTFSSASSLASSPVIISAELPSPSSVNPPSITSVSRPRVDTDHGFVHQIVAIQQDRDEYEKQSQINRKAREANRQNQTFATSAGSSVSNNPYRGYPRGPQRYHHGSSRVHISDADDPLMRPWTHDAFEAQQKLGQQQQQEQEEEKKRNSQRRMMYSRGGGNGGVTNGSRGNSAFNGRGRGRGGNFPAYTLPRKWTEETEHNSTTTNESSPPSSSPPPPPPPPPPTSSSNITESQWPNEPSAHPTPEKRSTRAFYQAPKRTSAPPPEAQTQPPPQQQSTTNPSAQTTTGSADYVEEVKTSDEKDQSVIESSIHDSLTDVDDSDRKKEDVDTTKQEFELRRLERKKLIENRLEEKKQEEIRRKERETARKQRLSEKLKEKQLVEEKEEKEERKELTTTPLQNPSSDKSNIQPPNPYKESSSNHSTLTNTPTPTKLQTILTSKPRTPAITVNQHTNNTSNTNSNNNRNNNNMDNYSTSTGTTAIPKERSWAAAAKGPAQNSSTPITIPHSSLNAAAEEFTPKLTTSAFYPASTPLESKIQSNTPLKPPIPHQWNSDMTNSPNGSSSGREGMVTLGRGRGRGASRGGIDRTNALSAPRTPIVSLSIDVGQPSEVRLDVYKDDDVSAVASEFGSKYGLTAAEVIEMEGIIRDNMVGKEG